MGRRTLTRGGTAAVLVLLALYVLLGGDVDLGGDDATVTDPETTTAATTPTVTAPAEISEEEAAGIAATLALIESGEPLPHDQDGTTFQNREGLLPDEPEGYYREYTVETPGADDRGARRLVIGSGGETYYTNGHYSSFIEIDPEDFR